MFYLFKHKTHFYVGVDDSTLLNLRGWDMLFTMVSSNLNWYFRLQVNDGALFFYLQIWLSSRFLKKL